MSGESETWIGDSNNWTEALAVSLARQGRWLFLFLVAVVGLFAIDRKAEVQVAEAKAALTAFQDGKFVAYMKVKERGETDPLESSYSMQKGDLPRIVAFPEIKRVSEIPLLVKGELPHHEFAIHTGGEGRAAEAFAEYDWASEAVIEFSLLQRLRREGVTSETLGLVAQERAPDVPSGMSPSGPKEPSDARAPKYRRVGGPVFICPARDGGSGDWQPADFMNSQNRSLLRTHFDPNVSRLATATAECCYGLRIETPQRDDDQRLYGESVTEYVRIDFYGETPSWDSVQWPDACQGDVAEASTLEMSRVPPVLCDALRSIESFIPATGDQHLSAAVRDLEKRQNGEGIQIPGAPFAFRKHAAGLLLSLLILGICGLDWMHAKEVRERVRSERGPLNWCVTWPGFFGGKRGGVYRLARFIGMPVAAGYILLRVLAGTNEPLVFWSAAGLLGTACALSVLTFILLRQGLHMDAERVAEVEKALREEEKAKEALQRAEEQALAEAAKRVEDES